MAANKNGLKTKIFVLSEQVVLECLCSTGTRDLKETLTGIFKDRKTIPLSQLSSN